jgi:hypothetical protein
MQAVTNGISDLVVHQPCPSLGWFAAKVSILSKGSILPISRKPGLWSRASDEADVALPDPSMSQWCQLRVLLKGDRSICCMIWITCNLLGLSPWIIGARSTCSSHNHLDRAEMHRKTEQIK